jgi:hypothetical protein
VEAKKKQSQICNIRAAEPVMSYLRRDVLVAEARRYH